MAKRASLDIRNKKSRSQKTKKRLAAKAVTLSKPPRRGSRRHRLLHKH